MKNVTWIWLKEGLDNPCGTEVDVSTQCGCTQTCFCTYIHAYIYTTEWTPMYTQTWTCLWCCGRIHVSLNAFFTVYIQVLLSISISFSLAYTYPLIPLITVNIHLLSIYTLHGHMHIDKYKRITKVS